MATEWSDKLGGNPSLCALVTVVRGAIGAVIGTGLVRVLGIRDQRAIGLALGPASRATGTARAFEIGSIAAAFAAIGLAANAIFTSALFAIALLVWARIVPV